MPTCLTSACASATSNAVGDIAERMLIAVEAAEGEGGDIRGKQFVALRVFQGTFAAEKNGEIHLYWELPSFIAFAEAETALHNDEEFLAILDEMGAAGQSFKSELLTIEITKD